MSLRIRRNEEDSKKQLIETTLELISKNGWENFSIRKLAAKCSMSPSNVVYHFESNEALMLALLNSISMKNYMMVESGLRPSMSAYEKLLNHFRGNLEWVEKYPSEAHIVLLIYSRAPFDKAFSKVFELMVLRAHERISVILETGLKQNEFHFKCKTEDLAATIHQLLLGASIYHLSGRKLQDVNVSLKSISRDLMSLTNYSKTN